MKVKSLVSAAALIAGLALTSAAQAKAPLSAEQLDVVSAGYFTYFDWYTPIEYPNNVNGFPYFYPGISTSSFYLQPLVIW